MVVFGVSVGDRALTGVFQGYPWFCGSSGEQDKLFYDNYVELKQLLVSQWQLLAVGSVHLAPGRASLPDGNRPKAVFMSGRTAKDADKMLNK